MSKGIIYELAYLISGQLNETQAQDLAGKIEKNIGENGAILSSIELKKIKLAYLIKKQQDGYLASVDFTCEPTILSGISKEVEKEADILRFLLIKKSPKKQEGTPRQGFGGELSRTAQDKPAEEKTTEEKPERIVAPIVKEKKKKETLRQNQGKPAEKERKEEDLKKIEKDLDEILGQ